MGADKDYLTVIYSQPWIANCSECDKEFNTKTRKIAKDVLYKHKASNCKLKYFY